jgi:hypothetical protein
MVQNLIKTMPRMVEEAYGANSGHIRYIFLQDTLFIYQGQKTVPMIQCFILLITTSVLI